MNSAIATIIFGTNSTVHNDYIEYIGNVTNRTATEASVHTVAVLKLSKDLVGVKHHFTFGNGIFESEISIQSQSRERTPELRTLIENIVDVAMSTGGKVGTFMECLTPGFSGHYDYMKYVDKYFNEDASDECFTIMIHGEMMAKKIARERFGKWTVIFDEGEDLLDHPMPVPTKYQDLFYMTMTGEMVDPDDMI